MRVRVTEAARRRMEQSPQGVCSNIQECTHVLWVLNESERSWIRRAI